MAPPANGTFEFVAFKTTGTNPGYDVKDASGRVWSVKLGIEAQSEVTTSSILWAMGFPQPPQYFVRQFTLNGVDAGVKTTARFRTETDQWRASRRVVVVQKSVRRIRSRSAASSSRRWC